ncbi:MULTISPECIES: efflux RND transporter periplasmic adaptor subunit [Flavobacterium]|jgi:RND family efflux transporter MFP subunit|uniref:RND family efflux transporter MFP subunit n=3 Tax=Flavobacterium TaxID=237 RepID=A0A7W7N8L1_9FLAO|nr:MULTISPECIES: efflux RND transporter periplasmic adaptor subunit [Flavobacterium]MBB4802576.1 RND family efflux transporter MFP subunit [Flavobacterium nitrogenifigens]MBB6387534.1 RND family efflux transporter MFP subunit [Flavobacterium notoginsengisoli]MBZ4040888.1 efflux RND transporter periplasmic adaptor subunit [Flavobacterium hibisci]MCR4029551.1 efflux RND transporter periplasmic adaptor subunit [Flavobacterium panacis]RED26949.1 RND family efflux transporter MFP subunit [Flavobact
MKVKIQLLIAVAAIFSLVSCGQKSNASENGAKTEQAEGAKEEGHGEEEAAVIAVLTQDQIKAVGITLGTIESKNLTAAIKANGALRVPNNNKANATSLYGGVIKTLKVQLGDHVRKGQVIATIENPQFIQQQEEYITINSRIINAEQELQRQRDLQAGNAGALKNLQNATAEVNALRARKASLQKQIQLMGINPATVSASNLRSALTVTSPVTGTVSAEFAKIGSYVDVSSPVVEIVDNQLIHLDLQVFEKDLPMIKVGQIVNFTLTNNPTASYTAKVFNIGSSFENESKTVAVHCTVTGNKTGLIDGMNITAMVSVGTALTTAVPNDAIAEADGKFYIFVKTDKKPEEHEEAEGGEGAEAGEKHSPEEEKKIAATSMNFEKVEVNKGVSEVGYTAVTPVKEIPAGTPIVTKGTFFVNAKLSNSGEHEH